MVASVPWQLRSSEGRTRSGTTRPGCPGPVGNSCGELRPAPPPVGPARRGTSAALAVGTVLTLDVGPVAHGGHCVARHDGQVVFVRHTLPGERVRARVTEGGARTGSCARTPSRCSRRHRTGSPRRARMPCPAGCGGCDWQHVDLDAPARAQGRRRAEQLRRLAGLEVAVDGRAAARRRDGLGWRTRVEFAVDPDGRAGLRRHRSHEVLPRRSMPIADPAVIEVRVLERVWPGTTAVDVVVPAAAAPPLSCRCPAAPVPDVTERVTRGGWSGELTVSARGFWQVHPGAPATFVAAGARATSPRGRASGSSTCMPVSACSPCRWPPRSARAVR